MVYLLDDILDNIMWTIIACRRSYYYHSYSRTQHNMDFVATLHDCQEQLLVTTSIITAILLSIFVHLLLVGYIYQRFKQNQHEATEHIVLHRILYASAKCPSIVNAQINKTT